MDYESDLALWADEQAGLLRAGRVNELDLEHQAEEIEGLSRRDRREIESRVRILLAHLLKWRYQPAPQSRSWLATITTQQQEVMALLEDSPSLRPRLQSRWQEVYSRARTLAEDEIGIASLPNESPWTLDQVLRGEYFANE